MAAARVGTIHRMPIGTAQATLDDRQDAFGAVTVGLKSPMALAYATSTDRKTTLSSSKV